MPSFANHTRHYSNAPRITTQLGTPTGGLVRYLTVVGLAFVALMVALEPDVGFSAPPSGRLLFWGLQVATGLLVLQWILNVLTRHSKASRLRPWTRVLLSGVLGSLLLSPIYWLIGDGLMEGWLGYPAILGGDPSMLLGVSLAHPLLREYVDIVGPVTASWVLICWPRMQTWAAGAAPWPKAGDAGTKPSPVPLSDAFDTTPVPAATSVPTACSEPKPAPAPPSPAQAAGASWHTRLPAELGSDIIAVASERQYLRVWTLRGSVLILGSLSEVESESVDQGLRVHRSWWVSSQHVVTVRRSAGGTSCLMSDGRLVPVSRRRSAEVLARFGNGAHYRAGPASESVTKTGLH